MNVTRNHFYIFLRTFSGELYRKIQKNQMERSLFWPEKKRRVLFNVLNIWNMWFNASAVSHANNYWWIGMRQNGDLLIDRLGSLIDGENYIFREYDATGWLYHHTEAVYTWAQLKSRWFIFELLHHVTHQYKICDSRGKVLFSCSYTYSIPWRVHKILH